MFAQETSLPGQFAQQQKLRAMAQEAAVKEMANSKLRRPWARTRSFKCADVEAVF